MVPLLSLTSQKSSRVSSWLKEIPLTPPPDEERRPLKRKRASSEPSGAAPPLTSMSSRRDTSPSKRPRWDADDVLPGQSASTIGSNTGLFNLDHSNTFSPPSSRVGLSTPRSGSSPSRETIAVLRTASPPIMTEPLDGVEPRPPPRVLAVLNRLESGLDQGWIPGWLEQTIKNDTGIGFQRLSPAAFTKTPTQDLSDTELDSVARKKLEYTYKKVKKIVQKAQQCQTYVRDENAWCNDVVRPMVKLALRLYGDSKLDIQSVQSQSIDPKFLSRATDASGRQRVLDRKADYTLSYSHDAHPYKDLYARLLRTGNKCVSHTTDTFTRTTAVFCGIEVKPSDGGKLEAEYKLSIWMAASLHKKAELARLAGLHDTTCLVEPGFTVVGHELCQYIAYIEAGKDEAVRLLEFTNASSSSFSGAFKQLRMWRNVVEYGLDEGPHGFWGGFLKLVLERLVTSGNGEGSTLA